MGRALVVNILILFLLLKITYCEAVRKLRVLQNLWARSLRPQSGSFHTRRAARDASRVDSERMVVNTLTRTSETNDGMRMKTILNRIQKHRGFVYGNVQLEDRIGGLVLTVELAPRRKTNAVRGVR